MGFRAREEFASVRSAITSSLEALRPASPTPFLVLGVLIDHAGEVVAREELSYHGIQVRERMLLAAATASRGAIQFHGWLTSRQNAA